MRSVFVMRKSCQEEHLVCQLPLSSKQRASSLVWARLQHPWPWYGPHPSYSLGQSPWSGWAKDLREMNFSKELSKPHVSHTPSWPQFPSITRNKSNYKEWGTLRSYDKVQASLLSQGRDAELAVRPGRPHPVLHPLTYPLLQPTYNLALAPSLE